MRALKSFEEYIKLGVIKKITPDNQRAENLMNESKRKYEILLKSIEKIGIDDYNSNDYIEDCYNILLFIIRAKMFDDGYKSVGEGSHEAEVSYFRNIGFKESEVEILDQLRYFRNGILYYGKRFDCEYAKKIIDFTKNKFIKLIK